MDFRFVKFGFVVAEAGWANFEEGTYGFIGFGFLGLSASDLVDLVSKLECDSVCFDLYPPTLVMILEMPNFLSP